MVNIETIIITIKHADSVNRIRSVQINVIHVYLKQGNVKKASFCWNAKFAKCKYLT